jgi:hypothetical protein
VQCAATVERAIEAGGVRGDLLQFGGIHQSAPAAKVEPAVAASVP